MNRRTYLATGVGVSLTGLGGCLSILEGGERVDGTHVWLQTIEVFWEVDEQRHKGSVLNIQYHPDATVAGEVWTELEAIASDVTDIQVDSSLDQELNEQFEDVEYLVGFCWEAEDELTCSNLFVDRNVFNRAQFGDSLDVRFDDRDVSIRTVREADRDVAADEAEVLTFEFEDRYSW